MDSFLFRLFRVFQEWLQGAEGYHLIDIIWICCKYYRKLKGRLVGTLLRTQEGNVEHTQNVPNVNSLSDSCLGHLQAKLCLSSVKLK